MMMTMMIMRRRRREYNFCYNIYKEIFVGEISSFSRKSKEKDLQSTQNDGEADTIYVIKMKKIFISCR